ncbi:concanavalin A-like lectin/glucanase domain-containing protein [Lentinula boryana]|uniref:Glucanase n=1 Tax=Lentinula boryana TaxID=40481 RepID=A0ABQ8Q0M6_9AGAR|nr:concanavalin A-like lectin/glucanase domain-containing protein [Lentinula boryana]
MAPGSITEYQTFKLVNQEFTMDVDVSQLPCGLNGAVYFSQMDADGGMARFPGRQEPSLELDTVTLNAPTTSSSLMEKYAPLLSPHTGTGATGTCCAEMDIWEANSLSAAVTPHPCTVTEQTSCTGSTCSSPNSTAGEILLSMVREWLSTPPNPSLSSPSLSPRTTSPLVRFLPFAVSTSNGVVIQNSETNIPGITATNEITTQFCEEQKTAFGDIETFDQMGGLAGMGTAFTYPTDGTSPGDFRGTCSTSFGVPATVEAQSPNAQVIYSNIKVGPIGSTFSSSGSTGTGTGGGSTTSSTPTSTGSAPGATQSVYGQCGGIGYSGLTTCASGSTCTESSTYYS